MNPFVNPKKRGVSLPSGCKDLVDVLRGRKPRGEDPVRIFVRLMLMQAHEHHATELVIGTALAPESTVSERVDDGWYHVSALPLDFRSIVVKEVGRMAAFPEGPFPKEGQIFIRLETVQLKWRARMASSDSEVVLRQLASNHEASIAETVAAAARRPSHLFPVAHGPARLHFGFAVKTVVLILTVVAMLAAVALTPYGRARWEFYRLTGRLTPQRIVESLQTPVHVGTVTDKGLLTADGKLLTLPGITNVVISDSLKKDIVEHGVEIGSDGAIYALVRVHHWCGNDPVVFHLARVNLSSLLLLVADGVRFSMGNMPRRGN